MPCRSVAKRQGQLAIPRLAFAGAEDRYTYGPEWEDVQVVIADPLVTRREEVEASGRDALVLPALDRMSAMHGDIVLPILRDWFGRVLR